MFVTLSSPYRGRGAWSRRLAPHVFSLPAILRAAGPAHAFELSAAGYPFSSSPSALTTSPLATWAGGFRGQFAAEGRGGHLDQRLGPLAEDLP